MSRGRNRSQRTRGLHAMMRRGCSPRVMRPLFQLAIRDEVAALLFRAPAPRAPSTHSRGCWRCRQPCHRINRAYRPYPHARACRSRKAAPRPPVDLPPAVIFPFSRRGTGGVRTTAVRVLTGCRQPGISVANRRLSKKFVGKVLLARLRADASFHLPSRRCAGRLPTPPLARQRRLEHAAGGPPTR